ncbi:hypothetical protein VB005_08032 [Metarhizium brunneum]
MASHRGNQAVGLLNRHPVASIVSPQDGLIRQISKPPQLESLTTIPAVPALGGRRVLVLSFKVDRQQAKRLRAVDDARMID